MALGDSHRASGRNGALLNAYTYLLNHSATLGELAEGFGFSSWKDVYLSLWKLYVVDTAGDETIAAPSPFDIGRLDEYAPPVDNRIPPEITKDTRVGLSQLGDSLPLVLSLPEVVLTLDVLDDVLAVTPPGAAWQNLRTIRSKLVDAASKRGYGDALWNDPHPPVASPAVMDALMSALEPGVRTYLDLTYVTLDDEDVRAERHERTVLPVRIEAGVRPYLWCVTAEGEVRSYRLDRIESARNHEGAEPKKSEVKRARALVEEQLATPRSFTGEAVRLTLRRQARWLIEELDVIDFSEDDDFLCVTLTARNLDFLATYMARIGTDVVAIEPEHVAAKMRTLFTTMGEQYA